MNEITIEVLTEPKLESFSGGGLKEIVAIVTKDNKKVGHVINYLQLGFKAYLFPEATGTVTTKEHYSTIEDAFKAGKEIDLF